MPHVHTTAHSHNAQHSWVHSYSAYAAQRGRDSSVTFYPRGRDRHGPWRCRRWQQTGLGSLLTGAGFRSYGGDGAPGRQVGDPSGGIGFALGYRLDAANIN
jgi:hypothetical protein